MTLDETKKKAVKDIAAAEKAALNQARNEYTARYKAEEEERNEANRQYKLSVETAEAVKRAEEAKAEAIKRGEIDSAASPTSFSKNVMARKYATTASKLQQKIADANRNVVFRPANQNASEPVVVKPAVVSNSTDPAVAVAAPAAAAAAAAPAAAAKKFFFF